MANPLKTIHIEPGSELDRILAEADVAPVEVDAGDRRYRISRLEPDERKLVRSVVADEADIWADYDPDRALHALRNSAGAISGVNRDQLLKDLAEQRSQDSQGRPA